MNLRITPVKLIIIGFTFTTCLLVLFIIGVGLVSAGVINDVTASVSNFLPVIFGRTALEPVATGNTLIVFSSTATTDGNPGGRSGMNQICLAEDPASHFCNLSEIQAAWVNRGVVFQSPFADSWVDFTTSYFSSGTVSNIWTDGSCNGWTANDPSKSGLKINENAWKTEGFLCNYVYQVSCCKSAP